MSPRLLSNDGRLTTALTFLYLAFVRVLQLLRLQRCAAADLATEVIVWVPRIPSEALTWRCVGALSAGRERSPFQLGSSSDWDRIWLMRRPVTGHARSAQPLASGVLEELARACAEPTGDLGTNSQVVEHG